LLMPSGYYMYRQFNIHQFYVYVFCMDMRTATISLYSINWLVFIRDI